MAYVHHSNYALYLEQARMDLFKSYGLDISDLERRGVILPVVSMEIRYLMPLLYGDSMTVHTLLKPDQKIKLEFEYRIFNQDQKLCAKAKTALVFAEKESGKLIPEFQKYMEPINRYEISEIICS